MKVININSAIRASMHWFPRQKAWIKENSADIAALAVNTLQVLGACLASRATGWTTMAQGVVVGSAMTSGMGPGTLLQRLWGVPLLFGGLYATGLESGYLPLAALSAAAVAIGAARLTGQGGVLDPAIYGALSRIRQYWPLPQIDHSLRAEIFLATATSVGIASCLYGNLTQGMLFALPMLAAISNSIMAHDNNLGIKFS